MPIGWIYQQGNAPIYVSQKSLSLFRTSSVNLKTWQAKSPDLNPVENLWRVLSRRGFAGGRQFSSEGELLNTMVEVWRNIDSEPMKTLLLSLKHRATEVLEKERGTAYY